VPGVQDVKTQQVDIPPIPPFGRRGILPGQRAGCPRPDLGDGGRDPDFLL